jgi:hypothetical protein
MSSDVCSQIERTLQKPNHKAAKVFVFKSSIQILKGMKGKRMDG